MVVSYERGADITNSILCETTGSRPGVVWMTNGWPLYESRLKGKPHVISKRYTQRIERHNLNLRQHLARLG